MKCMSIGSFYARLSILNVNCLRITSCEYPLSTLGSSENIPNGHLLTECVREQNCNGMTMFKFIKISPNETRSKEEMYHHGIECGTTDLLCEPWN